MKKNLSYRFLSAAAILLCYFINTSGQTIIFSEDFVGFTQGNHAKPYSNEVTDELDLRTHQAGWTGSKIYSAGGEIKLGTADIPGWIETPLIGFTGYEGTLKVKFDICRWPSDATSVKVLQDGTQIGTTLAPGDNFETVEIPLNSGATSSKIKFEAISKRFYLDNVFVISSDTPTGFEEAEDMDSPLIFPNPVRNILTIRDVSGYETIEILDISGKRHLFISTGSENVIQLYISEFEPGIYLMRFSSGKKIFTTRLVKLP